MPSTRTSRRRSYFYLTTTGRRTGRQHRIEIWFGMHGSSIYLLSGRDRSDCAEPAGQDGNLRAILHQAPRSKAILRRGFSPAHRAILREIRPRPRSSVEKSTGFLNRVSQVRFLPRAPKSLDTKPCHVSDRFSTAYIRSRHLARCALHALPHGTLRCCRVLHVGPREVLGPRPRGHRRGRAVLRRQRHAGHQHVVEAQVR